MVTIEEIREAAAVYDAFHEDMESSRMTLFEQRNSLTGQINELEAQIRTYDDILKSAHALKVAPLAEAYAAELQKKYVDAPQSITPEDFVTLSYGILTVLKEPELVTNFKETLEYLTTELTKEGELQLMVVQNHPSSGRGDHYQEAYSTQSTDITTSKDIPITFSLADLRGVYFHLGECERVLVWRSKSGYTKNIKFSDPIRVHIDCLAKRPRYAGGTLFGEGCAPVELFIYKKKGDEPKTQPYGTAIFMYPSKEAREEGHKSHEEMYRQRSATRGSEVDFLEEERQREAEQKKQLGAQLDQNWERIKANLKSA